MRLAAIVLMLLGLATECARHHASSPTDTSESYATSSDRGRSGYGLHLGLGGYISDGVWD